MKFRGVIDDIQSLREFSNTVNTLSKLGKQGTISLSPTSVTFIIFDESIPRRILAQCTLEQKNFFKEYTIAGVSEEFNQIYLQFATDLLARATSTLKTSSTSRSLKIKLTKKKKPCLTCEIQINAHYKHTRVCIHDIRVDVIPRQNWADFHLPTLPPFDLSFKMPILKRFKIICEKMKFLSSQLVFEATPAGKLVLKIETNLASVGTYFYNLTVVKCPEGYSKEDHFEVSVELKKIIAFLSIEQVNPNNVICNIVNEKFLLMEVIHDNVALHYLIPGTLVT